MNIGMTYESLTPITRQSMDSPVKVTVNGEEKIYCIVSESVSMGKSEVSGWGWGDNRFPVYTYGMEEVITIKTKTKEEIAAEESVAKAKEALKAAENALKVVKQSK